MLKPFALYRFAKPVKKNGKKSRRWSASDFEDGCSKITLFWHRCNAQYRAISELCNETKAHRSVICGTIWELIIWRWPSHHRRRTKVYDKSHHLNKNTTVRLRSPCRRNKICWTEYRKRRDKICFLSCTLKKRAGLLEGSYRHYWWPVMTLLNCFSRRWNVQKRKF